MPDPLLIQSARELASLLPAVEALSPKLEAFGEALLVCWKSGGKVLTCGNGGSAADALHFAEELTVRFQKNRRALAAIPLLEPTAMTCAGNDFGFDAIFSRQVEALARPEDIVVVFTTSGNSPNCVRAVEAAEKAGAKTASFLGRDGGKLKGRCNFELLVPAPTAHRAQECHLVLYHSLCEWVDLRVD